MELVSDDLGVRKVRSSEIFEGITEVQDYVFDVLATFDVSELSQEIRCSLALNQFESPLVAVVDYGRREFSSSGFAVFPEGMLVDADRAWPWVLAHPELFFEARVESFKHVSGTHPIGALYPFEIDEVFAGPKYRPLEAFAGSGALPDARNGLSERLAAWLAEEPPLLDDQENDLITYWRVLYCHFSPIVNRVAKRRAPRTNL